MNCDLILSSKTIKAEASRLGFSACGIAKGKAVDEETAACFKEWLQQNGHAEMKYMENHLEKRLDPTLLLPGLQTIVCVALNYTSKTRIPDDQYQIAAYAYGQDYHTILKNKLHLLAKAIFPSVTVKQEANSFICAVDTVPILERYWALQAGLGWIGRNHQLIIPGIGSQVFLGELLLTFPADTYDTPQPNRCGSCLRCVEACPTHALSDPRHLQSSDNIHNPTSFLKNPAIQFDTFPSIECLSYLTIENRGSIPQEKATLMKNYIYGCDRCQIVCTWNQTTQPTTDPQLQPKTELLEMTKTKWQHLSQQQYQMLFKGSAVKRAKYDGLMRNIDAVAQQEKHITSITTTSSKTKSFKNKN